MNRYGTWVAYGGDARVGLTLTLLVVAVGIAVAGRRLPPALHVLHTGRAVVTLLLLAWVLAIVAFLICLSVYAEQASREFPGHSPPTDRIAPVTFTAVIATFAVVLGIGAVRHRVRPASAVIAALAAPMIFELPFDLVVMARTYPPIPPHPALYRVLFFLPLFLVELTTLSLLMCSPEVRVTRWTVRALAAMFTTFAIWAAFGFPYPATPIPITANVVAKLLAFAATLTMLLPTGARTRGALSTSRVR